jgi:integrase
MTWDRVDMSRGVVRLELTKSGKRREVPMREALYDVMAGLPGAREGRVWPSGNIRTAFENAVYAARLDDFHFHDCRHHFASWFVMRGGSLQALKEILGHADLKMTLRYAHLAPDHLRGEMVKTEGQQRRTVDASAITQGITHERAREVESVEDVSRTS